MKKFVLAFLSLILAGGLYGQMTTTYGVFAGAQATTAKYKVRETEQQTGYKYGPLAGVAIKIPFENHLYFTPSFYYNKKGYSVILKDTSHPPGIDAIANETSIHTIDIAPLFMITMSAKPSHMFVQFGPVFDGVISGNERVTKKDGAIVERPMKFSFSEYGRITASVVGKVGFESGSGFFIAAQYAHGLGSLNNADGGPSIKHRVFGFMIGKFFNRDPNKLDVRVKE
jgi:hypothetical protein